MGTQILAVNPGAGSTRVALFKDEDPVFEETICHTTDELLACPSIIDQYDLRTCAIMDLLKKKNTDISTLTAVVGRGGPFKPLKSGTYEVNDLLIKDIHEGNYQSEHPSLLGVLIAHNIAQQAGIKAYFVDPVSVDEFWDMSRFSGLKEIPRKALSHALNVRNVAKRVARHLKKQYTSCNFVIIHLGTGITVAVHVKGQQVDSSNANEDGPFSPQRTGALPTMGLLKYAFQEGNSYDAMKKKLNRQGGMLSYLGTDNIEEIEKRIEEGDEEATQAYQAMIYQIAKETGAYSVVCKGNIDAIIITGGIAHSKKFVGTLKSWIDFLCPTILVYPGEGEMEALVQGVLRVLRGEEQSKVYE